MAPAFPRYDVACSHSNSNLTVSSGPEIQGGREGQRKERGACEYAAKRGYSLANVEVAVVDRET